MLCALTYACKLEFVDVKVEKLIESISECAFKGSR
jgi:hypothetical protein